MVLWIMSQSPGLSGPTQDQDTCLQQVSLKLATAAVDKAIGFLSFRSACRDTVAGVLEVIQTSEDMVFAQLVDILAEELEKCCLYTVDELQREQICKKAPELLAASGSTSKGDNSTHVSTSQNGSSNGSPKSIRNAPTAEATLPEVHFWAVCMEAGKCNALTAEAALPEVNLWAVCMVACKRIALTAEAALPEVQFWAVCTVQCRLACFLACLLAGLLAFLLDHVSQLDWVSDQRSSMSICLLHAQNHFGVTCTEPSELTTSIASSLMATQAPLPSPALTGQPQCPSCGHDPVRCRRSPSSPLPQVCPSIREFLYVCRVLTRPAVSFPARSISGCQRWVMAAFVVG